MPNGHSGTAPGAFFVDDVDQGEVVAHWRREAEFLGRAEDGRGVQLLVVGHLLVAEKDNPVAVPGIPQCRAGGVVDWSGKIHPAHYGPQHRGNGRHLHRHAPIQSSGWAAGRAVALLIALRRYCLSASDRKEDR